MQEIIISKLEDKKIIALVDKGKLEELYEERNDNSRSEGNIYYGIIKDILPGMQAAFVDIGEEKNTYLHIQDLIPKASKTTGNKEENMQEYNINDYAKKDMPLLVQVKKDASKQKGAKISTDINIPGRFVALLPKDNFITVSQKIENEEERNRLIEIAKKITNNKIGMIIRTAAKDRTEKELKEDIEKVLEKWNDINKGFEEAKKQKTPRALFKNESILEKILLDTIDNGIETIYVDDKEVFEQVNTIIEKIASNKKVEVVLKQTHNILDMYDIDDQIEETKQRKVWLKCGGFITIDKTEALTAIDVNSGKFTGKQSLEQTVLKVNEEASKEIAKQLRLRDIGGIVIIDYIDIKNEDSRKKVLDTLTSALKKDRSKTQIIEFTKLDLLELTRKHMFSE